jgi:hypothetical protein
LRTSSLWYIPSKPENISLNPIPESKIEIGSKGISLQHRVIKHIIEPQKSQKDTKGTRYGFLCPFVVQIIKCSDIFGRIKNFLNTENKKT